MAKKRAMSTFEVMFVILIIGIISALLFPSISANAKESQYVIGIKKAFGILNETLSLAFEDDIAIMRESEKNFGASTVVTTGSHFTRLLTSNIRTFEFNINDADPSGVSSFVSVDNFKYDIQWLKTGAADKCEAPDTAGAVGSTNACAVITVDVNGTRGPNALTEGKEKKDASDRFQLFLYETEILPNDTANAFLIMDLKTNN